MRSKANAKSWRNAEDFDEENKKFEIDIRTLEVKSVEKEINNNNKVQTLSDFEKKQVNINA